MSYKLKKSTQHFDVVVDDDDDSKVNTKRNDDDFKVNTTCIVFSTDEDGKVQFPTHSADSKRKIKLKRNYFKPAASYNLPKTRTKMSGITSVPYCFEPGEATIYPKPPKETDHTEFSNRELIYHNPLILGKKDLAKSVAAYANIDDEHAEKKEEYFIYTVFTNRFISSKTDGTFKTTYQLAVENSIAKGGNVGATEITFFIGAQNEIDWWKSGDAFLTSAMYPSLCIQVFTWNNTTGKPITITTYTLEVINNDSRFVNTEFLPINDVKQVLIQTKSESTIKELDEELKDKFIAYYTKNRKLGRSVKELYDAFLKSFVRRVIVVSDDDAD